MKTISDITGYTIIKCKNKETTEPLKKLHYELNDILYKHNKRYAFPIFIIDAYKDIIQYETQISQLILKDNYKPKQQEILQHIEIIKTKLIEEYKSIDGNKWKDNKLPSSQKPLQNDIYKTCDTLCNFTRLSTRKLPFQNENPSSYPKTTTDVILDDVYKWINYFKFAKMVEEQINNIIPITANEIAKTSFQVHLIDNYKNLLNFNKKQYTKFKTIFAPLFTEYSY